MCMGAILRRECKGVDRAWIRHSVVRVSKFMEKKAGRLLNYMLACILSGTALPLCQTQCYLHWVKQGYLGNCHTLMR